MKAIRTAVAAAAIVLAFAAASAADTLQLKNGSVVQGKYLGGSERAVQFEVNGRIELYNVDEILSITFTGAPQPASATAPASRPAAQTAVQAAPATPATGATVTVPAGTWLMVRMIDGVDSARNRVGDRFQASLEADLVVDGKVVAPRGTDVFGRLAEAREAGRIAGRAELRLELTDIRLNNQMYPLVTGEYEVAGEGRGGDTARKAAGGAAIGAVIGAIAGGGRGAAIGAGVGAGAGTAINVVTQGEQVRVPSETVLDFRLQQAATLPAAR